MIPTNLFHNWYCYYMDNDRQKVIVAKNLCYRQAVKTAERLTTAWGFQVDWASD